MSSDGEISEERCGFVLEPEDVPEHAQRARVPRIGSSVKEVRNHDAGSNEWYTVSQAVCCWREIWDGSDDGRCIWHTETDNKPADLLLDTRADRPERLDGAYVPAVGLGDDIDFEGCGLQAATFNGSDLQKTTFAKVDGRFAQFPDADLQLAQFSDVNLESAQFPRAYLASARFLDANLESARFPNADLQGVQFHNVDLSAARFPKADLWRAEFSDADLRLARFPNADLQLAQFPDATLESARFPDANLWWTEFPDALLRRSQFPNADLQKAEFRDANLSEARFQNANLRGTSFDGAYMDLSVLERDDVDFDGATIFGWSQLELEEEWGRAARTYRALQQKLREHPRPRSVRRYRVREMHMRRKSASLVSPTEWVKLALSRWTTLYGESPWRVAGTAVFVIFVCALVYPFIGGVVEPTTPADSTTHALQRVVSIDLGLPEWATEVLVALYFSVVTFTTLGYGDLRPATAEAQALATVESFVGALLMALLVAVLARRVTW